MTRSYALAATVLTVLGAAGCGGDSKPRWEWPARAPGDVGMDAAVLEGAREYAFQPGKNTQGVVVVRRGAIVAEWYEDGAGPDSYAGSWSVAKSFTSALIGIAVADGDIAGVGVPMTETYPAWAGTDHEGILLEHVLHMATGISWVEDYSINDARNSDVAQLVLTTESPLDYVLAQPMDAEPNTTFLYSSGNTLLMSGVIARATGMSAGEYAREKLFEPLGIEGAEWWQAKTGETLTYCCLDMTSRDFARFGLLYAQGGMWDGEQVVPAEWVEASLAPSPVYEGYGYQWWLEGRVDSALPADLFAALGYDGQFIYVIPSLELVVVRNGHYDKDLGEPIADPTLFLRYPSGGIMDGLGTVPPDSWSDAAFLGPIIASITD